MHHHANFMPIGQIVAEILPFLMFQNGVVIFLYAILYFLNCEILSTVRVQTVSLLHRAIFVLIGQSVEVVWPFLTF